MTDLITEARELCAVATPGQWKRHDTADYAEIHNGDTWGKALSPIALVGYTEDADFIARSRTLIPELCDALEKAEEQMPRWIPVTERLPTGCGYYLSVVERIAPDELGGNNTRVKIMRWMGADWRYPTHIPKWINEAITETVTHWTPLPEPPTADR